jgi:hypothetical protein
MSNWPMPRRKNPTQDFLSTRCPDCGATDPGTWVLTYTVPNPAGHQGDVFKYYICGSCTRKAAYSVNLGKELVAGRELPAQIWEQLADPVNWVRPDIRDDPNWPGNPPE